MDRGLEVEVGVPVPSPVTGDDRVAAAVLPTGNYATLPQTGHPDGLMAATGALLDWAQAKGLAFDVAPNESGERWRARLEIYETDPAEQPALTQWQTRLAFLLAGSD